MDLFTNYYQQQMPNMHYHHHHHPIIPQQQQQQYYNMPYYYPNEVIYPQTDYTSYALPTQQLVQQQTQATAYTQEKPIEATTKTTTDMYLYSPTTVDLANQTDPEVEQILRTNTEVWQTYQTGRFKVVARTEDGHKKIILKEKTTTQNNNSDDSEFIVRRFKVIITTPRNSKDHVLLMSFSQKSLPLEMIENTNQNLVPYVQIQKSESELLTGPGTDLINKIVNGDEDSFEMINDDGHYESAYEIQALPPSKSSSREKQQYYDGIKTSESSETESENSESSASTDQQDYIDQIINKIKNQVDRDHMESQGQVSTTTTTPVNVSYGSRYITDNSPAAHASAASLLHYSDNQEFQHEDSFGHVSRSSTRHEPQNQAQHDTHSIGPGSMAGGSLFGGYIPNHIEGNNNNNNNNGNLNIEKSAFSEYNLTKNEDGDYVLREANGRSEIFDGKSGYSIMNKSGMNESRSNVSRLEESSRG